MFHDLCEGHHTFSCWLGDKCLFNKCLINVCFRKIYGLMRHMSRKTKKKAINTSQSVSDIFSYDHFQVGKE